MIRALAAGSLLAASVLLAGCTSLAGAPGAGSGGAATDGPFLRAGDAIFDPVDDDVPGTEACDGRAGREALEDFDRAAWPDLQIPEGEAELTCGNADGAAWRHIADGHTGDFGELAALVDSSWEDVAWFAIDEALEQPTAVEMYRDDIANYDVLVEYVDAEGLVERQWMVTVGVGLTSGQIITAFPDER